MDCWPILLTRARSRISALLVIRPVPGLLVGAAVQFRMLATSGKDTSSTAGGLAAFSLLGVGGLLALPAFALPVILVGAPTSRGLVNAAVLGAVGFVVFTALGAVVLAYDAPLRWCGRGAQRLRNWVLRSRPPLVGHHRSQRRYPAPSASSALRPAVCPASARARTDSCSSHRPITLRR